MSSHKTRAEHYSNLTYPVNSLISILITVKK